MSGTIPLLILPLSYLYTYLTDVCTPLEEASTANKAPFQLDLRGRPVVQRISFMVYPRV